MVRSSTVHVLRKDIKNFFNLFLHILKFFAWAQIGPNILGESWGQ